MVSLIFLLFDAVDEISDIVYIVSEKDAGEEWDDDDEKGFGGVYGMEVTEADSENDGCSEIIAPNVLLEPL